MQEALLAFGHLQSESGSQMLRSCHPSSPHLRRLHRHPRLRFQQVVEKIFSFLFGLSCLPGTSSRSVDCHPCCLRHLDFDIRRQVNFQQLVCSHRQRSLSQTPPIVASDELFALPL